MVNESVGALFPSCVGRSLSGRFVWPICGCGGHGEAVLGSVVDRAETRLTLYEVPCPQDLPSFFFFFFFL
jgi:hypothetical protein